MKDRRKKRTTEAKGSKNEVGEGVQMNDRIFLRHDSLGRPIETSRHDLSSVYSARRLVKAAHEFAFAADNARSRALDARSPCALLFDNYSRLLAHVASYVGEAAAS